MAGWQTGPGVLAARRVVNRNVELADWLFTTPAVIVQPVTGVGWPIWRAFLDDAVADGGHCALHFDGGLLAAGRGDQIQMRRIAEATPDGADLPARYHRLARWWFALGWPAFIGVIIIFWLMVAKPEFVL
jgi:uncharacterized membrane protein